MLVAPLMPGINDAPEQVAAILELADEAGASYVTGIALHLRGDVRGLFFDWLRNAGPTCSRATRASTGRAHSARPMSGAGSLAWSEGQT